MGITITKDSIKFGGYNAPQLITKYMKTIKYLKSLREIYYGKRVDFIKECCSTTLTLDIITKIENGQPFELSHLIEYTNILGIDLSILLKQWNTHKISTMNKLNDIGVVNINKKDIDFHNYFLFVLFISDIVGNDEL